MSPLVLLIAAWVGLLAGFGAWALYERRRDHSLIAHVVAPLWARVPEKWRWKIVHRLDRSRNRCWSDLVDAALAHREADACDIKTPLGCDAGPCKSRCDWSHPSHTGEHDCSCYCGKFQQRANDGAIDRAERNRCDHCQRAVVACRCEQERARERDAEWWAEA